MGVGFGLVGFAVAFLLFRALKRAEGDRPFSITDLVGRMGSVSVAIPAGRPGTVYVRAENPRGLARDFIGRVDVRSLKFEEGAVVIETGQPDAFYTRVTELAASGEYGTIEEVTSPDDNLQAVFQYLVK